jgi:hypothetical protein
MIWDTSIWTRVLEPLENPFGPKVFAAKSSMRNQEARHTLSLPAKGNAIAGQRP